MKKFIIPILVVFLSLSAWSQQPSGGKIRVLKVEHITTKLNLSSAEAQQFWPVYNAYDAKITKLRNTDLRNLKRDIRNSIGNLSDAQAGLLLDRLMVAENDMHQAKITLVNDLKKVISAEKIIRLKAAEDEFNQILLQRLKEIRQRRLQRKN